MMKHAVITGASRGMGKAITEKLLSQQFDVAICSRKLSDLENLLAELQPKFPDQTIHIHPCDVSKKEEVKAFATFVQNKLDSIDLLVNNAGIFMPGTIHDEPEGNLEKQMETNVYGAYHLTRALLSDLEISKGHIFNICSIASSQAYSTSASYTMSKFALLGFSKVLRDSLKEKEVRVTALLPGATLTSSWEGTDLPESRFMLPEDVASILWDCYKINKNTNVEELTLRPILGDL